MTRIFGTKHSGFNIPTTKSVSGMPINTSRHLAIACVANTLANTRPRSVSSCLRHDVAVSATPSPGRLQDVSGTSPGAPRSGPGSRSREPVREVPDRAPRRLPGGRPGSSQGAPRRLPGGVPGGSREPPGTVPGTGPGTGPRRPDLARLAKKWPDWPKSGQKVATFGVLPGGHLAGFSPGSGARSRDRPGIGSRRALFRVPEPKSGLPGPVPGGSREAPRRAPRRLPGRLPGAPWELPGSSRMASLGTPDRAPGSTPNPTSTYRVRSRSRDRSGSSQMVSQDTHLATCCDMLRHDVDMLATSCHDVPDVGNRSGLADVALQHLETCCDMLSTCCQQCLNSC